MDSSGILCLVLAALLLLPACDPAEEDPILSAPPADTNAPPQEPLREYPSLMQPVVSKDGRWAYVVSAGADSVYVIDLEDHSTTNVIAVGDNPNHAVLSADGTRLYVSCRHAGRIDVVDTVSNLVIDSWATGAEPYGLALSVDERELFIAESINNSIRILDTETGALVHVIPVRGSPRYLAASPDGSKLLATSGLGRHLNIIDLGGSYTLRERDLGRANLQRGVVVTSDSRWAFVAHIISHEEVVPFQMERGWIHANGITVVDLKEPEHRVTMPLDRLLVGASNPWGLALSEDERFLYVALAGVHRIAVIDVAKALDLVGRTDPEDVLALERDVEIMDRLGIARHLPAQGLGPRGLALDPSRKQLLVANYFSDSVAVLALPDLEKVAIIKPAPAPEMTDWRRGELLFNDARMCFQEWFACASCHQEDATVDGLSWDLPNDGVGNTKNAKSLHDAHDTPPAMWRGVRADLDAAVQAGQRFCGFLPKEQNHRALVAFLSRPPRAPNPYRGKSPQAEARGKLIFQDSLCDVCHKAPTYSDGLKHDVGLYSNEDLGARIDTPSLRDCYRTGPYLHDGRAASLRAIFEEHNATNSHGRTSALSPNQLDDLIVYLRTL